MEASERKIREYLETLCIETAERSVGTLGNRQATRFFRDRLIQLGWQVNVLEFDAIDWQEQGATLQAGGVHFPVLVSPYSKGCDEKAVLHAASDIYELEKGNFSGGILLLHGQLAREQLMPKNFVFYNPEDHQKIISLLEASSVKALVCATGRNPELAGGIYPFPLIEDGDFDIPSVYTTEEEGKRLLGHLGQEVLLHSVSRRISGNGYNVMGRKGKSDGPRVVVSAHIDAKKGTPGAIDNATGVALLLMLAEMLQDYSGNKTIELVAFNGEDYYAVPGQMAYINANAGRFNEILLNINIDGAGYHQGKSCFSFFDLPGELHKQALEILEKYPDIVEAACWPQGDHSIFVQHGRPAIAVSSKWFIDNMSVQQITHTPADNLTIVEISKLPVLARALKELVERI